MMKKQAVLKREGLKIKKYFLEMKNINSEFMQWRKQTVN